MSGHLPYFAELCKCFDLRLMKTIDDDTVSDPKPRVKKHIKDKGHFDRCGDDKGDRDGAGAKFKKEYKLEKSRKLKEAPRDIPDMAKAAPPGKGDDRGSKGDRKSFDNRKNSPGRSFEPRRGGDQKSRFRDGTPGRRPEGGQRFGKDRGPPRGERNNRNFRDKKH
jgi:hypothetical protein